MKNTKLLFEMLLVGLIFVTCLFKSRERVCAGELQVECVLHKIEICNICQHDFNSSLCSHTKGLSYGGKECKPNEEKYCNICSENIIYCEHKEGVVYDTVECDPWEKCNICGNNYFDPYGACSHWKGEYYGGEECSTYEIYVCNICGENYWGGNCPHHEGAWYDEGYCELDKLTICNICGNNYYDPNGACSHWKGEMYGQVECTTTTICNICGNNYFDPNGACSHWKGNRYGGTVCEYKTVKTCNLCGQSECEHEVGKIYGGEECTTTDKMMCSVCNDWYRDCCHIVGREYKNIVYYFYMDSRREYVRNDVIDLENIRDNENNPYNSRNKIYAVVKIKTDTQDEFDKAWNSLGMYDEKDCNIYSLIMNMHGTPTEIFSDVGSSPMRMSIQDVEKLKTKPVQRLVLLQCSVGKIEKAGENIASAFARSVTGKVLAGDGVVNQNEVKLNKKENNTGDDFCKEGQNIFVRYYVDDEGWYIYKHDWNERNVKYTYVAPSGKMYRLYQLINMLDI